MGLGRRKSVTGAVPLKESLDASQLPLASQGHDVRISATRSYHNDISHRRPTSGEVNQ